MPTAPAGAGESEPKQLPQRGMRERESRKGKNTLDSEEPKSDTLTLRKRELGDHRVKVGLSSQW